MLSYPRPMLIVNESYIGYTFGHVRLRVNPALEYTS